MRRSVALVFGILLAAPLPAMARDRAATVPPKSAVGWLRRAADLTDIRFPGSKPFHMVVTFHGYPGLDFAPKGKSPIMTGDGTYQETWISPHEWRREITYGSYHAVEVEAGGVRKFQASSDYEPSRVLMLMRALIDPVPRYFLEPELQAARIHWKLKRLSAGNLQYVHISNHGNGPASFDFLPDGVLVRSSDIHGLVTSWWDGDAFGLHLVPMHFSVQALGHDLVTAEVKIGPAPKGETITQLPGKPADPGMTLRPFDSFLNASEVGSVWPAVHLEMPNLSPSVQLPAGDGVVVSAVIDRQGTPREVEMTWVDESSMGHGTHLQVEGELTAYGRGMVQAFRKSRFRPPLIDGSPCEVTTRLSMISGGVTFD